MAPRVQLQAQKRDMIGKKVRRLRREGVLPATVYGNRIQPQTIQMDAHALREVMKRAGTTQLIDLVIDGQQALPVVIRQTAIDAKRNSVLHVEFYRPNLLEKSTSHVPVHFVGESPAVKDGGIFLSILDHINIESLPTEVPEGGIEVDISQIREFNGSIHARDLQLPQGVTLVTDSEEMVCKVNPPVSEAEVEQAIADTEPLPAELGGDTQPADAVPEA